MNNLFRKIGVGAIALSLVLGGAVSSGLVANADSSVKGPIKVEIEKSREEKLDKINDVDIVKLAEKVYGFDIFGFYLDSSSGKRRMKNEVEEVLEINSIIEKNAKRDKIEKILKDESNDLSFDYGKDFIEHLYQNGIDKGVKKIKIGDFIGIFVFKKDISPKQKDWIQDIDKKENLRVQLEDLQKRDAHLENIPQVKEYLKKKLEL